MSNSASLLLNILEEARQQRKDLTASNVWMELLKVDNIPDLMGAIGQFLVLADTAAKDVLAIHDDTDGVGYWRTRIYNGFHSTSLGSPWSGFRDQINDVTIFTLRSHAKILGLHSPVKGLSDDETSKVHSLFEDALAVIRDSNVDDRVRLILMSRIEQIQALLRRHWYMSPEALLDAAKILAAELAMTPSDDLSKIKEAGAYSKMKEGLEIMANATQVVSTAFPAIALATPYLLTLLP